eukprot:Tamp_10062.p1 GENE.Tamp_10062~~Tamp_10062.p1  ORF type:complete len:481 (+),score=139.89 Tamp_10062:1-1443(+)
MGAGSSSAGTVVYVDELQRRLEERLQLKYERGMRRVLPSLASSLGIFVALQQLAMDMDRAASDKIAVIWVGKKSDERLQKFEKPGMLQTKEGRHALKDGASEAHLAAIRTAAEDIVVTVEMLGRDFPACMDFLSLLATVHAMREAAEVVSSRFSRLEGLRIDPRWVGNDFAAALKRFVKLHDQLPQALAELENRVEDSRPLTQHLSSIKNRILALLPPAMGELSALPDARGVRNEHEAAQLQLASAREEVDTRWGHARLQEGLLLRARAQALTQRMDSILEPFIRISQNIKDKRDHVKAGPTALTDEELQSIHKYTELLLRDELYASIEDGGASIEDFLEALFLLGIAGGVGMAEGEVKASESALGFSRKSQALLSDALACLDADGLRGAYNEWREAKRKLEALEVDAEFVLLEKDANIAADAFEEAAKYLDRLSQELSRVEEEQERSSETLSAVAERVQIAWAEEFGENIEVLARREEQ